jgi:hypothetical protein
MDGPDPVFRTLLLLAMRAALTAAPESAGAAGEDFADFLPQVCALAGGDGIKVGGEVQEVPAK